MILIHKLIYMHYQSGISNQSVHLKAITMLMEKIGSIRMEKVCTTVFLSLTQIPLAERKKTFRKNFPATKTIDRY